MKLSPRFRLLLLAVVALASVIPASAQNATATIRGTIAVESGSGLPDAEIIAINQTTGFVSTATSRDDGSYILAGLPPGTYDLQVVAAGYEPKAQSLRVQVGQSVDLNFQVTATELLMENVVVIGEQIIETRTPEVATNVSTEQIENLPQNNRNFLSFAALAPGVRYTDNTDAAGQGFRSGGADARQVNVFIDGQSFKNDLLKGGAFMQDSSRGNPFPQNAVQEFRVLTQNYKAEYEKAAAAVISAVTKSGSNELHGDVFYLFQDKGMITLDDFAKERGDEKPEYERTQAGVAVGGPIVHDKLHFFLSWERNEQDRITSVFRGGSFDAAPANVRSLLSQFETGSLTQPFESDLYFGKLSWQPKGGQLFDLSYHLRDEQEVRGFGGQRVREGAESFEIGTDALTLRHQMVFGDSVNQASATFQKLQWNPTALNSTTPRQNYIGILDVGGKDATQDFKQDKIAVRDDYNFLLDWHGAHTLKAGLGVTWADYTIEKQLFDNPLFEFRSDEQWQFPFQARLGFGDPSLDFSNTQLGVYFQDDWALSSNFTLNIGLRWDYETNMLNNDYETPAAVVHALNTACRTYSQPVGGQTQWCIRDFLDLDRYTTDGNDRDAYTNMFQPRIGFSWDVKGDAKTVVYGGWGKYYDRVNLNDIFDEQYRQSWGIYSFCFSADGRPAPGCSVPALRWQPSFLSAEGLRGLIASGQASGPEIWLTANDLKPPRSEQWTLGVRQQFGQWATSLAYAGARGHNGLAYFFGDLPPGTAFGDRFGGNVRLDGYARVFVTSSARRTWYDAAYLTIDKPYTAGSKWGFNLSYTYAKASANGTDNPGEDISFGAFDYINSDAYYKFDGTNDERHRLVMSGTVGLPWNFRFSSFITLGSGTPYTIFDASEPGTFVVRWNEGRPEKKDFIIPDAWAYRSVDARLEWDAPAIADRVRIGIIAEGFNVFGFDNDTQFESFKPTRPAVNPRFGQPNAQINTRRYQLGLRVGF